MTTPPPMPPMHPLLEAVVTKLGSSAFLKQHAVSVALAVLATGCFTYAVVAGGQNAQERNRLQAELSASSDRIQTLQTTLSDREASAQRNAQQLTAAQAQLKKLQQSQQTLIAAERERLEGQFRQQLAQQKVADQDRLQAVQDQLQAAQAASASTELPQTDAGMVPVDEVAVPSSQDLFEQRCLDAIRTFFDGADVNQTSGGMTSATPWIEGSPYWFWNVNIRVSGTEHVEPFKCRSSRDTDFELLQGW